MFKTLIFWLTNIIIKAISLFLAGKSLSYCFGIKGLTFYYAFLLSFAYSLWALKITWRK